MFIRSHCVGMTVVDSLLISNFFQKLFDFQLEPIDYSLSSSCSEFLGQPFSSINVRTLRLGREILEIRSHPNFRFQPLPSDTSGNDQWFRHFAIVTSNIDIAFERIREHVIFTSTSPQTLPNWNIKASGIKAFKFKTPEHHSIELIQFPPGKGKQEWQSKDALFLGIDHTAISVTNVLKSKLFYEKVVGMHFLGQGTNYGLEQENLDGIQKPKVEVVSFGVDEGLGLEFLHYMEPSEGRTLDEHAGINWYFRVAVSDLDNVAKRAYESGVRWVSNGIVEINDIKGFRKGIVLRDPDGHVVEVMQSP